VTDPSSVEAAMDRVEVVCHLASILGPSSTEESTFFRVNVGGTETVLQAARQAGVRFFLHCSSCGIYGSVEGAPVNEDSPPAPLDAYERSKQHAEDVAISYGGEKLPVCIVRPAWVYGPGDRRTCKLFRAIARRRLMLVGKAQNRQHPVYIDDVIEGLWLCLQRAAHTAGRSYILAGSDIVTIEHLCTRIARAVSTPLPGLRVPIAAAKIAGVAAEWVWKRRGKEGPIDRSKVDFFIKHRAYDITRSRTELGFAPRVGLDDGLARAAAFYRKEGWL
jgi:nucleoside-diphosphate-sugar epimerase